MLLCVVPFGKSTWRCAYNCPFRRQRTNKSTHLEVSVSDGGLLFVHVLHGFARLVEDLQHCVAWKRLPAIPQDAHQFPS